MYIASSKGVEGKLPDLGTLKLIINNKTLIVVS
jgi:hypothetical protein